MRRLIVLVSTMVLPLLVGVMLLSGVALAEDVRGTFKPDDLQGTNQKDRIYGDAGSQTGSRAVSPVSTTWTRRD